MCDVQCAIECWFHGQSQIVNRKSEIVRSLPFVYNLTFHHRQVHHHILNLDRIDREDIV